MMRRWLWIGLAVIVFLGGWSVWLWQSYFVVEPGQQAVVERGASVEVLDAGLHLVSPFGGNVTVYDVLFERQHRVAEPVMVDGCAVSLILTYNVADVVAFHEAGGDIRALAGRDAQVLALAEAADLSWEGLRSEMAGLREAIQGIAPPGIAILRTNADVGACERPAPEEAPAEPVEVERVAIDLLASEAPPGANRVELDTVQLLSRDDARLELSGALGTYDVVDAASVETCFGPTPERHMTAVIQNVFLAGLRETAGGRDVTEVARALSEMVPSGAARLVADCGLRLGPVDLAEARLEWIRAAR